MQDFAPDRLVKGGSAPSEQKIAVAWKGDGLPTGAFLMGLVATSKQRTPGKIGAPPFRPEHVSGYCAS